MVKNWVAGDVTCPMDEVEVGDEKGGSNMVQLNLHQLNTLNKGEGGWGEGILDKTRQGECRIFARLKLIGSRGNSEFCRTTMVWNKQEYRLQYWATRSSVRSFARTAHSFACSLSSLTPSLVGQ